MRGLSALAQLGVLAFMLVLLSEIMSHSMWGGVGNAPSTLDFAVALFGEWCWPPWFLEPSYQWR